MALECGDSWKLQRTVMEMLSVSLLVSQISEFWPCFPDCDMYCLYERNALKLLQRASAGTTCHFQYLPLAGEDGSSGDREEFSVGLLVDG